MPQDHVPGDITREPLEFPMARDIRLQALSRGDEGFLLALGYSTQRGYARNHPFVGEIRIGEVELELDVPELPFAVPLGTVRVTECQMVNQFKGSAKAPPQFTRGYGLVFGQSERKAMAMALCDRALRASELGEDVVAAAQDEEFVISHSDNVQATGFVEHLKLPHYVDFQAELDSSHAPKPCAPKLRQPREAMRRPCCRTRRRAEDREEASATPAADIAVIIVPRSDATQVAETSPPTTSPISTSRPSG